MRVHRYATRSWLRPRRGLSLVEVMISLVICSLLLTAVATAFRASTMAIEDNDQFFRASQAARVAMNQMLMQLRRSDVIDVPISNPANRIAFVGDDKVDRSFVYAPDATGQKGTLTMLIDNGMSMPISAVLARDVKVSFSVDTVHPETGSGDYVDRVSIDMTVEVGKSVVHLAGSAAPRRVQTFN